MDFFELLVAGYVVMWLVSRALIRRFSVPYKIATVIGFIAAATVPTVFRTGFAGDDLVELPRAYVIGAALLLAFWRITGGPTPPGAAGPGAGPTA